MVGAHFIPSVGVSTLQRVVPHLLLPKERPHLALLLILLSLPCPVVASDRRVGSRGTPRGSAPRSTEFLFGTRLPSSRPGLPFDGS